MSSLSAAWESLSLLAVVDILIVAFLIYQLLLLVRGTRAWHILMGILFFVALYYVSRHWHLQTLHWLLTTLIPYSAIGLIVIFQAEIRRGLARLGRSSLLPRIARFARAPVFDDILMAVAQFGANRVGALIVLERDIGLRTFIESGIGLDAQLSYDLLLTIFRPGTPLHDGAVIIQRDRVAAAACFLPLSVNPLLSPQLGTRHRAAIGITEDTDAVAIVVSEQTGAVSLAVGGIMEENITLEKLRVRLSELFSTPISPSVLPATSDAESAPPSVPAEPNASDNVMAEQADPGRSFRP